jgi:hypothetical protein
MAVKVSVGLMVVHQWVAFALYCTPLLYMWEKLIGTHTKPWYIRLPSRLPVGELAADGLLLVLATYSCMLNTHLVAQIAKNSES